MIQALNSAVECGRVHRKCELPRVPPRPADQDKFVATARVHGLRLLTVDERIVKWEGVRHLT